MEKYLRHISLLVYGFEDGVKCNQQIQRIMDFETDVDTKIFKEKLDKFLEQFGDISIPGTSD